MRKFRLLLRRPSEILRLMLSCAQCEELYWQHQNAAQDFRVAIRKVSLATLEFDAFQHFWNEAMRLSYECTRPPTLIDSHLTQAHAK